MVLVHCTQTHTTTLEIDMQMRLISIYFATQLYVLLPNLLHWCVVTKAPHPIILDTIAIDFYVCKRLHYNGVIYIITIIVVDGMSLH